MCGECSEAWCVAWCVAYLCFPHDRSAQPPDAGQVSSWSGGVGHHRGRASEPPGLAAPKPSACRPRLRWDAARRRGGRRGGGARRAPHQRWEPLKPVNSARAENSLFSFKAQLHFFHNLLSISKTYQTPQSAYAKRTRLHNQPWQNVPDSTIRCLVLRWNVRRTSWNPTSSLIRKHLPARDR